MIGNVGWLINVLLCDGFFDCASVLTKSVAEMTNSLAYVLNVAFVALYINEIGRGAGDVIMMSYKRLCSFVGREKSVRRSSLCNERTCLTETLGITFILFSRLVSLLVGFIVYFTLLILI